MTKIGIVEGFFGPVWSHEARVSFAPFMQKYGGEYYIYAPKRDANLRKAWREEWSAEYKSELTSLRDAYHQHQLKFGVGISPFGLGRLISSSDWTHLKNKFELLSHLKMDYLGLFFDDMPTNPDLLKVQSEVVHLALKYFPQGLIFCPSYYTFDPILDKVFGQRPVGYVEGLKSFISHDVEICWTGPKVISDEISKEHLHKVNELIGRKPFIWENVFANDGPRNCKFLKLRYFTGRDESLVKETSGVAFNMMNEAYLSQLSFLSSLYVMKENLTPSEAFGKSCFELYESYFAQFILKNRTLFLESGLDNISLEQKESLILELDTFNHPAATEIKEWLKGNYIVGPECLTD